METANLAQHLIEECRATKSKKLDLGYCGLTEIPEAVFELTWLEELYLCNAYYDFGERKWVFSNNEGQPNQLSTLPDGLANLKGLQLLFIGADDTYYTGVGYIKWNITDISVLKKLKKLKKLNLRDNKITDLSPLKDSINLIELNIGQNKVSNIESLKGLINLVILDISNNNIKDFSILKYLTILSFLNFRSNGYTEVNVYFLNKLPNLTYLDLAYNFINDYTPLKYLIKLDHLSITFLSNTDPSILNKLTTLTSLDLKENDRIKNFYFLENLTKLNTLNLSLCKIKDTSKLEKLVNLTWLNLNFCGIKEIIGLKNLINLTYLSLDNNAVTNITELKKLTKLTQLYMDNNKVLDLSGLENLTNLTHLSLNNNQIISISKLRGLTNLISLNLNKNKVSDISPLNYLYNLIKVDLNTNVIPQLPSKLLKNKTLKILIIFGNPIKYIPNEILEGTKWEHFINNALPDLRQWYADLAKGSIPNYYFKLLILGNGRVGKSCIVDALQNRDFDSNKKTSHAIVLEKYKPSSEENTPEYFIWDFGGQEIYHSTHKWFMRSRAVYLVVWDRESEQQARIADPLTGIEYDNHTIPYWINTIRSNNPDIPILLIENKLDEHDHKPLRLTDKQLPQKYRADLELSRFSAAESKRYLRRLESDILMITESLDEYGQEMPLSWHKVRQRILACIFNEEHKATLQKLSKTEFKEWCADAEVLPKSAPALLRFLHRTGVVYADEKLLGNTILIDQQWAIDAIYKVLDRESDFFLDTVDKKGRFPRRWLFREWNNDYTESDKQLFLQFMISCKLCFKVNDKDKNESKHTQYAIPQLMPENPPTNVTSFWTDDLPDVYYLEFEYDFLHYATVQDFIVEMGRKTNLEFIWKNGIAIPHQGSQALVKADVPNKIIHIRTMGSHRAFLLSAIRNAFRAQIDKDLQPTVQVSNDGVHFVDLGELQELQAADNPNIRAIHKDTLEKQIFEVSAFDWALVRDEKADLKTLPDVVQITTPSTTQIPKVFISYSRHDVHHLQSLKKQLSYFDRKGQLQLWDDHLLVPGESWDAGIKNALATADIILFLVTPDLLATSYVVEVEMETALQRHQAGETVLIPVIVRDCLWTQTPLAQIQALPRKGVKLADWPDADAFWRTVAEGVLGCVSRG